MKQRIIFIVLICIGFLSVWIYSLVKQSNVTATREETTGNDSVEFETIKSILIASPSFVDLHATNIKAYVVTPMRAEDAAATHRPEVEIIYIEAPLLESVDQAWLRHMYEQGTSIVGIQMPISHISLALNGREYLRNLPNADHIPTVDDLPLKEGWLLFSAIDKNPAKGIPGGEQTWYYQTFGAGVESVLTMRKNGRH